MGFIDQMIIDNSDAIRIFGLFWVAIFFSIGIVFVVVALVFRNKRRTLISQKGRTEFARFYSDPKNLVNVRNDMELRDISRISRVVKGTVSQGEKISYRQNHERMETTVFSPATGAGSDYYDFYFEFNDDYYLPDE